jgi:membrane protein
MYARVSTVFGFLRYVWRRWSEDRCPQVAGSLTYTTLLAMVPMFAIAVALLSALPFFEDVMVQIKVFLLLNLLPEIAHTIITVYMEQFAENAARLTTVGIVVLFVMAIALMLTMDRALNTIWRVGRARPYWVSIVGYAALLITAPLLIGLSMSFTTYLVMLSMRFASVPPEAGSILIRAVPVSISTLAFFLLYRIIPHRHVPWRHALLGAVVTAILFEATKEALAFYVRSFPTYHLIYGTFALVPIFLIWLYVSWLAVLFGAELAASLEFWSGSRWRRDTTVALRFREAVAVARRLTEAGGEPIAFERLRLDTGIAKRELEEVLARLGEAGIVRRDGSVVALARDPESVTLADLHAIAHN